MGAKPLSYPGRRHCFHTVIAVPSTCANKLLELYRPTALEQLPFCALVVSAPFGYHVLNSESQDFHKKAFLPQIHGENDG